MTPVVVIQDLPVVQEGTAHDDDNINNTLIVGSLPQELFKLTKLEEIILFVTELSGTLSTRIGDLSELQVCHHACFLLPPLFGLTLSSRSSTFF